jgi:hypothetical protein
MLPAQENAGLLNNSLKQIDDEEPQKYYPREKSER